MTATAAHPAPGRTGTAQEDTTRTPILGDSARARTAHDRTDISRWARAECTPWSPATAESTAGKIVSVTADGTPCPLKESTATSIICETAREIRARRQSWLPMPLQCLACLPASMSGIGGLAEVFATPATHAGASELLTAPSIQQFSVLHPDSPELSFAKFDFSIAPR